MPASCLAAPTYERRTPETSILYRTVQAHLETFLARTAGEEGRPGRLRYRLAWNHALCRAVLGVALRVLLSFYTRQAWRRRIRNGRTGSVTVIQRSGGAVNLNIHFHTLVLDGVFTEAETGELQFHAAPPPSDAEVTQLVASIRTRVRRLLERRGLEPSDDGVTPPDPMADASLALAGIMSASVQGRIALGPRAGARGRRIGAVSRAPNGTSRGPRQAHLEGFDLHANVCVPAEARAQREQLCRYLLRPPVAEDRLHRTAEGMILVELKHPWADGTSHLLFEPLELPEKLAALIPRPQINLVHPARPPPGPAADLFAAVSA